MNGVPSEFQVELDWRASAKSSLAASPVVGVLAPIGARVVQIRSGAPRSGVQDIALKQRLEPFHGGGVTDERDASHGALILCRFEDCLDSAGTKLRISIGCELPRYRQIHLERELSAMRRRGRRSSGHSARG